MPPFNPDIFDPVRKINVVRTPEEVVRQSVLNHLLKAVKVPPNLIGVEYSLSNITKGVLKKADIVVWIPEGQQAVSSRAGPQLNPWLLVECKRPQVSLSKAVDFQVSQYVMHFPARYLWMSNGKENRYYHLEKNAYRVIRGIPEFHINRYAMPGKP